MALSVSFRVRVRVTWWHLVNEEKACGSTVEAVTADWSVCLLMASLRCLPVTACDSVGMVTFIIKLMQIWSSNIL